MGMINVEDIMGFFIGQKCVCCDCVTKDEEAELSENGIITSNDTESGDSLYFCDRCEKQIG